MAPLQYGIKYTLTGPDGTIATFNDKTDPNYVGMLSEVTGLDSPDIREAADDLVQFDGGIHGDFFYGRRPIVMTGIILNPLSTTDRNQRTELLGRASNALRGDALLKWQPDGYPAQQIAVRRQQPLRITGGWQKEFQLGLVAADPRVYSQTLHTQNVASGGSGGVVSNAGTTLTWPVLKINGFSGAPGITNATTGQTINISSIISSGNYLLIDTLNRTVLLNGVTQFYGAVNFSTTSWWGLAPGSNTITMIGGGSVDISWRDAWM